MFTVLLVAYYHWNIRPFSCQTRRTAASCMPQFIQSSSDIVMSTAALDVLTLRCSTYQSRPVASCSCQRQEGQAHVGSSARGRGRGNGGRPQCLCHWYVVINQHLVRYAMAVLAFQAMFSTDCCAGEDVGHYGGSYKVTYDLHKKYGDLRLLDTPICGMFLMFSVTYALAPGILMVQPSLSLQLVPDCDCMQLPELKLRNGNLQKTDLWEWELGLP